MKITGLNEWETMHTLEKVLTERKVGGMGTMAIDKIEMRPDEFSKEYDGAYSVEPEAPQSKGYNKGSIEKMLGNPWAPNDQKVFIDLNNGRVSGALGPMRISKMLTHQNLITPLEQGGLGATQTTNTSKKTYWMPAQLYQVHVNNKKI